MSEQREAAWIRYRDRLLDRRAVVSTPQPSDLRLAFEAGYEAAIAEFRSKPRAEAFGERVERGGF